MNVISQRLEEMLDHSQLEKVGVISGLTDLKHVSLSPDGKRIEAMTLPSLSKIIEYYRQNLRAVISGNCRTLVAGIGGVLLGENLAQNPQILINTSSGHFILRATDSVSGDDVVIDMGRRQPIPIAAKLDGSACITHYYKNRFGISASGPIVSWASTDGEIVRFSITNLDGSYLKLDRPYISLEKIDPSTLAEATWIGIRKGLSHLNRRFGTKGTEEIKMDLSSVDHLLVSLRRSEDLPFPISVDEQIPFGAPLKIDLDEEEVVVLMRLRHALNRNVWLARGGEAAAPFESASGSQLLSARRIVLGIASGQIDSPREQHDFLVQEWRREGWKWGEVHDPREKTNPTLTSWDALSSELREWHTMCFLKIKDSL